MRRRCSCTKLGDDLPARSYILLQVLVNSTSGTACGLGPPGDLAAATVICKQLGLGGHGYLYNDTRSISYDNRSPIWIINVTCSGKERGLQECSQERDQGPASFSSCYPAAPLIACRNSSLGEVQAGRLCQPSGRSSASLVLAELADD